jgi:hypothetical protein
VSLGIFEEEKEDQAKVNIIFIRNEADLARTLSAIPILVSPLLLTTAKWVSFSYSRCETEARIIMQLKKGPCTRSVPI